ncbi:MAG: hypothetical protein K8T20_04445 [Planctomycetes bacterium]|nr:hypothetical protein [Planctomycetota bacterium]
MKCPERRAAARTYDFGSSIALNTATQESTAFDAIPMGRANAVQVCIVVIVMPAASALTITALVGNDDENYMQLSATVINVAGTYTFQATQVAAAHFRLGAQAQGAGGSAVFSISAITGNI